mgnify:FL=1
MVIHDNLKYENKEIIIGRIDDCRIIYRHGTIIGKYAVVQ